MELLSVIFGGIIPMSYIACVLNNLFLIKKQCTNNIYYNTESQDIVQPKNKILNKYDFIVYNNNTNIKEYKTLFENCYGKDCIKYIHCEKIYKITFGNKIDSNFYNYELRNFNYENRIYIKFNEHNKSDSLLEMLSNVEKGQNYIFYTHNNKSYFDRCNCC